MQASVVALNDEYQVAEEAAGGGSDEDEDEDDEDEGIEEEEGEGEEEASEGEDEGELEGAEGEEEGQEEDEHHDGCGGCAHHAHHHHTSTCTKGGAPRTSKAAGTVGSTAAHDSSQHGIPVLHKQHPSEPGSVQEPLEAGEPQKKLVQHQGPLLLGGVDLRLHIAICDAPDASGENSHKG
jgi:ribosomal protein L37E